MWKQHLNIDTSLVNQEWKVYLDTRKQLAYQIARAGGSADMPDPGDFLSSYTSDSGMNDSGWNNHDYDMLVKRAKSIADLDERYRLFQEAEAILVDEVPVIPIYFYSKINLRTPRVKNWHENLLDYVSYKDVYLAGE
jgi:oligopeptide transport system substrate-binding protein